MAIWIPQNLHERIKLETQMPLSARQYLINNPRYPSNMPPGYVLAPNTDRSQVETVAEVRSSSGQPMFVPVYPMGVVSGDFHMPSVRESAVKSEDVHRLIPGTSMTKEDLNRKVMSQLIEHKMIQSGEFTLERSQPKSCLRKSVTWRETNGELDSGISSTLTDDEEKQDRVKEVKLHKREEEDEDEDDVETLTMQTHNTYLDDTNDSGIGTEPSLLFSMSDHRRPRKPQTSIPERRPPWRHFSKGSSGGGVRPEVKPFRETALKCPPQARSQPIYIDAELAFDMAPPTYLESRPTSVLSTYDSDYLSYPTERPQSQLASSQSQDFPAIRSSVQYDNSYRYPADNISPHSKMINTKVQQSPMMQAEKIYYYEPPTQSSGVVHRDGIFETIDHSAAIVPDGPINRKSVFRTVNKDGIKSDRIQMEWLLRNMHNRPHPPAKGVVVQTSPTPTHKAFATRDMARMAKETAYMEYRRMQVVKREESFKEKESSNQRMQEARNERCRTVTKQRKQTDTVVDMTTVRVCRKYTADVRQREIQRQQDDLEKLDRSRSAKRAVSFKIANGEKGRAEREAELEHQRMDRLKGVTQRRLDIETQREKEIQETIARRRDIKAQNMTARSLNHLEQIGERRQQEAARDDQMRKKEIHRREHFRKIEADHQNRKDLRLAMHENKLMDLRSQVLP